LAFHRSLEKLSHATQIGRVAEPKLQETAQHHHAITSILTGLVVVGKKQASPSSFNHHVKPVVASSPRTESPKGVQLAVVVFCSTMPLKEKAIPTLCVGRAPGKLFRANVHLILF
jgi:hypothetical protein